MICAHINCTPRKGVWLPLITYGRLKSNLQRHPYCEKCGTIKNIGGNRGRTIGYYTNVLIAIGDYINRRHSSISKLTKAEIRLIAKALETDKLFTDTYGTILDAQEDRFIEEVRKYRPDLTENFIRGFL